MSEMRFALYVILLILLIGLCYIVIEALYLDTSNDVSERGLVAQLVAFYNVPFIFLLALIRLWLLWTVKHKRIFLDAVHVALPIFIASFCFASQLWVAIILSVLGALLTLVELFRSYGDRKAFRGRRPEE